MERDIPDVVEPVKAEKSTEKTEGEGEGEGEDEDEGEQPILGHVSMATDLVRPLGIRNSGERERDREIHPSHQFGLKPFPNIFSDLCSFSRN